MAGIPGAGSGAIFQNPSASNLFYGFEPIFQWKKEKQTDEEYRHEAAVADRVIQSIGSVVGLTRVNNPEAPDHNPPEDVSTEAILDAICHHLGGGISFPNPFSGECGITYDGKIISFRATFALYETLRAQQMARIVGTRSVLEIGAGLGRAALFSYQAGLTDYSIVDIPLTPACQAYFLAGPLGPDAVTLFGEDPRPGTIRILPPSSLSDARADLMVNVDSMTEMDRGVAQHYVDHALANCKAIFMVNHEVNTFRTADLLRGKADRTAVRYPCPVRSGYIEDLVFV